MLSVLDSKCEKIIKCLLISNNILTVQEISNRTEFNRRNIYYSISKINEWLESNDIEKIVVNRKGISLNENQINQINRLLKKITTSIDYQFSPEERIDIIISSLILKKDKIYVENLIEKCRVSRNSILTDLKVVEEKLKEFDLSLKYNIKDGYCILGDIIKKRSLFFLIFNKIINFYENSIINLENDLEVNDIYNRLIKIINHLNTDYVSGVLYSISVLFASLIDSEEEINFSLKDKIEISNSQEYKLVCEYFSEYTESNKLYLTLHLLGSRVKTSSKSVIQENYSEAYSLAVGLVKEFSNFACIEFEESKELTQALFIHLKSSLYRYKYGIQLINPMLSEIKNEYKDLFEITKQATKYIENELKITITDSEIAYITLHFGSYLDYKMLYKKKIKIVIICPNGISTANMLKKEVSILLPNADIEISNFDVKENDLKNYQLIIATNTNLDYIKGKNILIVNPILTNNDKVMIMKKCMDFPDYEVDIINSIIDIAKKYIKKDEIKSFKIDLLNKFNQNKFNQITSNFTQPGLTYFLKEDFIHIYNESMKWEDSIKILGKQLIEEEYVKEIYINSIVNSINRIGAYMFITPEVVIAHAKPADGTLELGINMGIFKRKIKFPGEKYAKIIFLISAIDQVSHLHILNDIVNIASDKKIIEKIYNSINRKEVLVNIRKKIN